MMESVIHGLSNEAYHHEKPYADYLSSSQLKAYLKSPRHAKFILDNPQEEKSDALRLGSLFHDLMACCAEHYDNGTDAVAQWLRGIAVFKPPVNDKTDQPYGIATKVYKKDYEAFLQASEGKLIATDEELSLIQKMNQSLLIGSGATSEQVCKLLRRAKAVEVSYFYETEDGIKLKIRPDLLTRDKLVDWKTCSLDSLDEDSIARQIIKYRYDVSLAMYQYVLHEIEGKWFTPILVFVQKQPPFDAVMCDISEWCYSYDKNYDLVSPGVGAMEFRRLLDLHTECVKNNSWPGAENSIEADGMIRIMKPKVPAYFGMKYFNE